MVEESPATPPEALQALLSEEEIAYRKQLQEHLSNFSDKREDAKLDAMSEASDAKEDMMSKASRFLPKGE